MVPTRIVYCRTLPLLPSGKVDRVAIRERSADLPEQFLPSVSSDGVSDTERTLIGIWERVLGVRHVQRTDHFFTIGGDSLSAVTVILEVEAAFAIKFTVRAIFEAPTLYRFAERVNEARQHAEEPNHTEFIFPLAEQGKGNPIFFSHVDTSLARRGRWSADCPLYAMTLWSHGKGFVSARSMEALARDYIDRIRVIQPHGPYRLAGYSFGGLVALEVAQQLRQAGEPIELLFLLDPSAPFESHSKVRPEVYSKPETGPREGLVSWALRCLSHMMKHPREAVPYVMRWLMDKTPREFRERLCYLLVHLCGRHSNALTTRLLPKNRSPAFWYVSKRLGRPYAPRRYEGNVLAVFLKSTQGYDTWRHLLNQDAEVHLVEADHAGETGLFSDAALPQWLSVLRARLAEEASA